MFWLCRRKPEYLEEPHTGMERTVAFQQEGSGSEGADPVMNSGPLGEAPVFHVALIRNKQWTAENEQECWWNLKRNKRWSLLKIRREKVLKNENHLFNAAVSAHTHQSGVTLIFSIYR